MRTEFPIFTYLYGKASGKVIAKLGEQDDGMSPLSFVIGAEEYCAYVNANKLPASQLALFDGHVPEDGLPRGAESLDFEYGRTNENFRVLGVKLVLAIEKTATVIRARSALGLPVYPEREILLKKQETQATMARYLLLVPRGHIALVYRIKPRSLAHQHTTIEARDTEVIFRSVVR